MAMTKTVTLENAAIMETSSGQPNSWHEIIGTVGAFFGGMVAAMIAAMAGLKRFIPGLVDNAATAQGGQVVEAIQGVREELKNLRADLANLERKFTDNEIQYARIDERLKAVEAEVMRRRASDIGGGR